MTVLLSDLGLDALGIDLSPGMVSLARRNHPQFRFDLAKLLHEAGFELWPTAVRQPSHGESVAQGYILARKPRPD